MSSTSRFILRHSEWNRLRRIVNSHAFRLVPRSKRSMLASARTSVSWTRSSARSKLPVNEIAKARNDGTAASMASRSSGSTVTYSLLRDVAVEVAQEIEETIRNGLIPQFVVHGAEPRADMLLYVAVQTGILNQRRVA